MRPLPWFGGDRRVGGLRNWQQNSEVVGARRSSGPAPPVRPWPSQGPWLRCGARGPRSLRRLTRRPTSVCSASRFRLLGHCAVGFGLLVGKRRLKCGSKHDRRSEDGSPLQGKSGACYRRPAPTAQPSVSFVHCAAAFVGRPGPDVWWCVMVGPGAARSALHRGPDGPGAPRGRRCRALLFALIAWGWARPGSGYLVAVRLLGCSSGQAGLAGVAHPEVLDGAWSWIPSEYGACPLCSLGGRG